MGNLKGGGGPITLFVLSQYEKGKELQEKICGTGCIQACREVEPGSSGIFGMVPGIFSHTK